ncbi:MAG: AraC family transcriptional regulator [Pseudomonadota bacterium]
MSDHPTDITLAKLRRLATDANIKVSRIRAMTQAVLANGLIRVVEPADGLVVSAASLKGQKTYSAEVESKPGLTVEIRLSGHSESFELDEPKRITRIMPGQVLVSGMARPSPWKVTAASQSLFETVSIRYTHEFIQSLAQKSPGLTDWASAHILENGHGTLAQTVELKANAQQILFCARRWQSANQKLLLHSIALRVLALIWQAVEPQENQPTPEGIEDDVIAYAMAEIERNPSASLTIEALAQRCRVSETSLKTRFKQVTGQSVGAFVVETRMHLAAEMLGRGVPVKVAAETLGYASAEAFSKAVKQRFGKSPRLLSARAG